MRVVAVALLLVLAGCGGGSSEPAATPSATTAATSSATDATPTTEPTTATPKGTPAPEALSEFRCEQDAEGRWNASGVLSNSGKAKVTYQVTIYIGQATGGEERARTKQVPSVAPDGSVEFTIKNVPAPKSGGPCHVQVLVTSSLPRQQRRFTCRRSH
ncbi:hypothetical protein [Aeromicrobium sp. UC242_57]|uniref:hypothetical protein n=1 Tax=Aeromicrobium sp. UC242_57 TaxID=3374624 RepID=UPI0037B41B18